MPSTDVDMSDSDATSTLSESLGTETLEARSITLHRYALDTLAIPATSAECERIFSSAKKLVTPERNRLSDDIIEAIECLKAWWDSGIISQPW